MRRCLHTLLIALLTLALSTDAARACWFLRARRQCRPAVVSRPCPPPASSGCGEVVVVQEWSVHNGCCQPVVCPPAAACSEESVVVAHESALASEVVGDRAAESLMQSVVREQPTLPGDGQAPAAPPADPQPEPPAPRSELVQPASNNEPLPDLEPVEPPATAPLPADMPATPPVEAAPEMQDEDLPAADVAEEEMQDEDGPGLPPPPVPETPVDEAEETADEAPPRRPLPPLPGIDDDEPPMEEEAAEPAIDPAAPLEPAPAVEPEPKAEPNLFEEFEEGDTAGAAAEGEMVEEEMVEFDEADSLLPGDAEPIPPAAPAAEPADLPFDGDPIAADVDPLMADEEDADAPAPAEAGDSDDEPAPAAADESDPFAEADDSDSLAAVEPVRRWIHASGAHSLVARLIKVEADGGCLLETESRQIRVPLANLSGHDRDYLRAAGVRLAALREARERSAAAAATSTPQATDTAGL